jgi:hypothetical protein
MGLSFPDPIVLDFDHGLRRFANQDIPMIPFNRDERTHTKMITILRDIRDGAGQFETWQPKTVVIDQGTAVSQHLEAELKFYSDEATKAKRAGDNDGLMLSDYNVIHTRLTAIIDLSKEILRKGIHLVWIFGLAREKDEMLGRVYEAPSVTGSKFSARIPEFFDEVYYFSKVEGKFQFVFSPPPQFPYCGSKSDDLVKAFSNGTVVDPSWEKIKQYF